MVHLAVCSISTKHGKSERLGGKSHGGQATRVQEKSLSIYEFCKDRPGCYSGRKAQAMAVTGLGFGSQPPRLNK